MAENQRRPAKRGWKKDVATSKPDRTGPVRGWRKEKEAPGTAAPGWSRRQKFAVLWGGVFLVLLALVGVILWLIPAKPVAFVLVGAGYEDNLAVPQNVYGWQGLQDLKQMAEAEGGGLGLSKSGGIHLAHDPLELKKGDVAWDSGLANLKEKAVVVSLALHGGKDANGPYLLYHNADLGDEHREENLLRVHDVLKALKDKVPGKTNKLLILDATQVPSSWAQGMLHNDFARGLQELNKEIEDVENLVVLSASDVDQRSWASDEWRQTAFMHYVIAGLKGAADKAPYGDGDGRITAGELYKYVKENVQQWVRDNREALQVPVLLGGQDRAAKMELFAVPGKASAPNPEPAALPSTNDLAAAWKAYHALEKQVPPPWVYTPQQWQLYQAKLLRYEELVLAGDQRVAPDMKQDLQRTSEALARAPRLEVQSAQNTLAMPAALALSTPWSDKDLDDKVGEFLNKPPEERAALVQQWDAQVPEDWGKRLLHLRLLGRLLERAAQSPGEDLPQIIRLLKQLPGFAGGNQRPAEVHFLAMLAHLDLQRRPGNDDLRLALRLRRLAEDVALAVEADETSGKLREGVYPYSEQVFPWIKKQVERADRERQLGQDLLFATDNSSWTDARKHLNGARDLYRQAEKDAAAVRSALEARDEVLAVLPAYSHWLADRRDGDSDKTAVDLLKLVEELWTSAHTLAGKVETVDPDNPKAADLEAPTRDVRDKFKVVEKQFDDKVAELLASGESAQQGIWHALRDALVVPRMSEDTRMRLLRNMRQISRQFWDQSNQRFSGATPIPPEKNEELARARARRQGRMCLAVLGERWFDDPSLSVNLKTPNYHDTSDRVSRLATDPKWAETLGGVGEAVSLRWRRLPVVINARAADARIASLSDAADKLRDAERLARLAEAGEAPLLKYSPGEEARNLRLHDLLLWQVDRTFTDHWYGDDPEGEPYYRAAGLRYLADARDRLGNLNELTEPQQKARLDAVSKHDKLIREAGDLITEAPAVIDVTSEKRMEVPYSLRPNPAGQVPPGFAVFWTRLGTLLEPPEMKEGRQVREVLEKQASAPVTVTLRPKPEATPSRVPKVDSTDVTLEGFYRGQVIHKPTPVHLHRSPSTLWVKHPAPRVAGVAVRAEPNVWERYSPRNGAIAIVLDCSGSMRAPVRQNAGLLERNTPCKYKDAVDALEEVLSKIDPGVTVSIWTFAQSGPEGARTVKEVERTIQMVRPPEVWTGKRQEMDDLMDKVRPPRLQPWNETPLVRAMWRAQREGFPKDFQGFKTVIALTDGIDNRFWQDTDLWEKYRGREEFKDLVAALPVIRNLPEDADEKDRKIREVSVKPIAKFIEQEFKDCGVQVNLVGFKIDEGGEISKEAEELFKKQFAVIEKERIGKIYTTDRPTDLVRDLKRAMKRSLRFYIERLDAADQPGFKEGMELSQMSLDGSQWMKPLAPGLYEVRVTADRVVRQRVQLDAGDFVLLTLAYDRDRGLHFERALMGEADPKALEKDGWLLATHQDQRLPNGDAQMLLSVENRRDRMVRSAGDSLRQLRPRAMWLEIGLQGRAGEPPLRWENLLDYPAPTYGITLPEWAARQAAGDRPVVYAWINWQEPATKYARDLDRGSNFENFFTRPQNKEVQLSDPKTPAFFESVTVEPYEVQAAPGAPRKEELCLVVRLRYTKGHPVWADITGLNFQGQEHRLYAEAGKYTGLFWPVTRDDAQSKLQSIHVMPVDEFKKQDTTRAFELRLDPPDPRNTRPPSVGATDANP